MAGKGSLLDNGAVPVEDLSVRGCKVMFLLPPKPIHKSKLSTTQGSTSRDYEMAFHCLVKYSSIIPPTVPRILEMPGIAGGGEEPSITNPLLSSCRDEEVGGDTLKDK